MSRRKAAISENTSLGEIMSGSPTKSAKSKDKCPMWDKCQRTHNKIHLDMYSHPTDTDQKVTPAAVPVPAPAAPSSPATPAAAPATSDGEDEASDSGGRKTRKKSKAKAKPAKAKAKKGKKAAASDEDEEEDEEEDEDDDSGPKTRNGGAKAKAKAKAKATKARKASSTPDTSVAVKAPDKDRCPQWDKCIRLSNQIHMDRFLHPQDLPAGANASASAPAAVPTSAPAASIAPSSSAPTSKLVCKFGAACYRKNPDHLRDYEHPVGTGSLGGVVSTAAAYVAAAAASVTSLVGHSLGLSSASLPAPAKSSGSASSSSAAWSYPSHGNDLHAALPSMPSALTDLIFQYAQVTLTDLVDTSPGSAAGASAADEPEAPDWDEEECSEDAEKVADLAMKLPSPFSQLASNAAFVHTVDALLHSNHIWVVAYLRAHDRCPGGNQDEFTLKYVYHFHVRDGAPAVTVSAVKAEVNIKTKGKKRKKGGSDDEDGGDADGDGEKKSDGASAAAGGDDSKRVLSAIYRSELFGWDGSHSYTPSYRAGIYPSLENIYVFLLAAARYVQTRSASGSAGSAAAAPTKKGKKTKVQKKPAKKAPAKKARKGKGKRGAEDDENDEDGGEAEEKADDDGKDGAGGAGAGGAGAAEVGVSSAHESIIIDGRGDSDEYDTEWSSTEIRVFALPVGSAAARAFADELEGKHVSTQAGAAASGGGSFSKRKAKGAADIVKTLQQPTDSHVPSSRECVLWVHRSSIFPNEGDKCCTKNPVCAGSPHPHFDKKPTKEAKHLFIALHKMTNIGRVERFSDGGNKSEMAGSGMDIELRDGDEEGDDDEHPYGRFPRYLP